MPQVTLPLGRMAARVGATLNKNGVRLPQLTVSSVKEMEDLVVDLVKHRDTKLKGLQDTLRQGRASAPLFDTAGWVDSWELSLGAMVEHMATGLSAPSHLVV